MTRYPVSSSNISSVGWEDNVLEIEFRSGGVYRYDNVPQSEYLQLIHAGSVGQAFHRNIKGRFAEEKIE